MRIISQDGTVDLPYESIGISRYDMEINAIPIADSNQQERYWALAEYSTEAKARKAMEMLQVNYLSRMELDGGYDEAHGCYVQPNYWVLPKVFQFPKDGEVEVAE